MDRIESLVNLDEKTESDAPTFFDISDTLRIIPPIDGEFDPNREVRGILRLPTGERRQALEEFKDKLARQREAWATCRVVLENQIELYPDTPGEALKAVLHEFAKNYGFASHHVGIAEGLIDSYGEYRRRLLGVRERCPNDAELIERTLGVRFSPSDMREVEVVTGSVSLEITCSGFNAGRLLEGSNESVVGFMYGGFATKSRSPYNIYVIVVNRDYRSVDPKRSAATLPHEREHQKNDLLKSVMFDGPRIDPLLESRLNSGVRGFFRHRICENLLGLDRSFAREALQAYEYAKDTEERRYFIIEYMRMVRDSALNEAKDEILAIKAEQKAGLYRDGTEIVLGFAPWVSPAHDYLASVRDRTDKLTDGLWRETALRILVSEYLTIIRDANASYERLLENGYTVEMASALLTDVSLPKWPKVVKRILEERKKQAQAS